MTRSFKPTAVLDTNVIYPLISRDLLFWFAHYDLFIPKWSKHIFNEWHSVMIRKGISKQEAIKRIEIVNKAFPDALIENYEQIIPVLDLPDKNDRHVVAAAIKSKADIIVTNNLKDFPIKVLMSLEIQVISADDFLAEIIEQNPSASILAFREMASNRKNPIMTEFELLGQLRNCGLIKTADLFQEKNEL